MKHFAWASILALSGSTTFSETHRLPLSPENVHWGYFDARIAPVLTITSGDEVLVETHMAQHFDLSPGDTLQVFVGTGLTEVTMLGEVATPEYLFPSKSRQDLITTPDDFGVLFVPEAIGDDEQAAARLDPVEELLRASGGEGSPRWRRRISSAA